ncbi:hypothetical protein CDAR_484461 [Caerostris darwini]|uniref:Uncharacterized protein n=1 Tax=Caerostris darwini TaxID=1538125 RepID=A0AAV4QSD0_9ARAC|nr:hypothetical protein CDAR_484461 [Caerostris darwini]
MILIKTFTPPFPFKILSLCAGSRNYKASLGLPFSIPPATIARHWGNFLLTARMSCLSSTTRGLQLREQHPVRLDRSGRPVPVAAVIKKNLG